MNDPKIANDEKKRKVRKKSEQAWKVFHSRCCGFHALLVNVHRYANFTKKENTCWAPQNVVRGYLFELEGNNSLSLSLNCSSCVNKGGLLFHFWKFQDNFCLMSSDENVWKYNINEKKSHIFKLSAILFIFFPKKKLEANKKENLSQRKSISNTHLSQMYGSSICQLCYRQWR